MKTKFKTIKILEDMFKEEVQRAITTEMNIDSTIRLREGQYINKPFLEAEGLSFKCSAGRYEFWESNKQKVIVEPLHGDHCIVYRLLDK